MNIHERLEAVWTGLKPDRIPYTIYENEWKHVKHDPAWHAMFERGLGVTWNLPNYRKEFGNTEISRIRFEEGGKKYNRVSYKTPMGELSQISIEEERTDDWVKKYFIETQQDYRVMTWIINNLEIYPDYERFMEVQKNVMPYGVLLIAGGRTPLQTILVDWVGLENFSYHLFDYEAEVMELYEALLKQFDKMVRIMMDGPGRFVAMDENFTSETLGPARFAQFHVPVYEKYYPLLHASGKIVGNHYDGKLRSCKELVARAPIDVIESLTPPGEGDMMLDECRRAWPDKIFWSNIRVSDYNLPPEELHNHVLDLVQQASPDGRRLAFEVSEHLPANWRESMPVVLAALLETSC